MRRLSSIILNQQPLALSPNASVEEACKCMQRNSLGSVLVVSSDDALVGIFTGRDLVRRVIADHRDAASTPLEAVMTPDPSVLEPECDAMEALRLMWDGGFGHVPVVSQGRIVGVVTRHDFKSQEKEQLEDERDLWEHMR